MNSESVKVTQPGVVYFTVAGVHSIHRKKWKELFPAHRQRAAGSCQTEVAAYVRLPGVNIKKVLRVSVCTGLKTTKVFFSRYLALSGTQSFPSEKIVQT